jgi:MFS family permease
MSTDFKREIERNYRRNAIAFILEGVFFVLGLSFLAYQTFLPLYVRHLTDSKMVIGLLSTLGTAGWLAPQLLVANWTQRLPRKKVAPVRLGFFSERLPIMLMTPVVWLTTERAPLLALIAFLALYAWHCLGVGLVAVAWQDLMGKLIPVKRRGMVMGITMSAGTAVGVIGSTIASALLERYGYPQGYTYVFAAGSASFFVSWLALTLLREPAEVTTQERVSQREYWGQLMAVLRSSANFRRYLFSQVVVSLGGMANGFLAVYAVQQWGLSDERAGRFTIALLIGQALSNVLLGVLGDRKGHKLGLELSALSGALSVGLTLLAPAPAWLYAVFALNGISTTGIFLCNTNIVLEIAPPKIRATYIGLSNTIRGVATGVAPIIGGWLAETTGYQGLFIVALVAGVAGLALVRWSVREPRQASLEMQEGEAPLGV